MNEEKNKPKSKEIDIIGVLKTLIREYKLLAKWAVAFIIIGVIVALNIPKQYTAYVVLAPEMTGIGNVSESLSDIASMVGVDLNGKGSSVDAIYPDIYPDVLASSDFIVSLFNVKVTLYEDDAPRTYFDHLTKDSPTPFWSYPMIMLKQLLTSEEKATSDDVTLFDLSKSQQNVCDMIRENIACVVDKKTSVITISATDIDKKVAAIIVDTIQNRMQQYITDYRTKKARVDLAYVEMLNKEAKIEYEKAKKHYDNYADAHTNASLSSVVTNLSELENDMELKFSTYKQMNQKLQLSKSKVQERTPVFTIIQSASIPKKASSFPRSFRVIAFMLFGLALCSFWILYGRNLYHSYRK